jgi:knotted carbamoyltransferase YgeW
MPVAAEALHTVIDTLPPGALAGLRGKDFLLTWDKSREELETILSVAAILRRMRADGISPRVWDSGLAVSQFRDNSTRTRFSFASACNLLGLAVSDLDEGKSQAAHGETVRETATMISFMADVIGIRDDMYIGKGHSYMLEVASALERAHRDGVLEQRPTVVNLQCDIDHPTQSMADLQHIASLAGGVENLRGKRIAMSWAYSPSYGKPLSVPQGVIGLSRGSGWTCGLRTLRATRSCPTLSRRREPLRARQAVVSGRALRWLRRWKALITCTPRAGLPSPSCRSARRSSRQGTRAR